jgi:hypothetical protein
MLLGAVLQKSIVLIKLPHFNRKIAIFMDSNPTFKKNNPEKF